MRMVHPVRVYHEPDEEVTVKADYQKLIRWLSENGHMTRDPQLNTADKATHHMVTTPSGLEAMKEDLWDRQVVALDTETFLNADIEHYESYLSGGHEAKKSALLWWHENFEMVCYQLAGQAEGGGVTDTYTVAMGFRDELTSEPYQDITPEQAVGTLDELLRHAPQGQQREIYMWNALFDCPVLTRSGIDLWGILHQDYPARVWDGQIIMGRMHEHMGGKAGRTTLDNAARVYLHEGKPAFDDQFDPDTFAYENISDPETRERVLAYTGEDPRKTLLVVSRLFGELQEHTDNRKAHTAHSRSNVPQLGYSPFPQANDYFTGSRLQDVAIPLDHQMVPMIGEMEMLGFRFDTEAVGDAERYTEWAQRELLDLIQERVPGYNPNSADDSLDVLWSALRNVASEINRIAEASPDPNAFDRLIDAFQIEKQAVREGEVGPEEVRDAFERAYGPLNAQKQTINNKFLVYYNTSLSLLRDQAADLGHEVQISPENEPEELEMFFQRVFLFKQIGKKFGTYFERFAEITDRNEVIHPFYLIISTLSGRFSGNFQNVPRGGPEDIELILDLFEAIGMDLPDEREEQEELAGEYNRFDVRQACYPLQAEDLNKQFEKMNLPWSVDESKEYCEIGADYAGQEDRMAYAESGDETKARLLSNPDLDTHFYNVSFCFGDQHGFDTSEEEGTAAAYQLFTKTDAIETREEIIRRVVEADGERITEEMVEDLSSEDLADEDDPETDVTGTLDGLIGEHKSVIESLRGEIKTLRTRKKEFKKKYRTPMKTVHYASQYGAGVQKLHTVLKPIFLDIGEDWAVEDTEELKAKYDELYSGVTEAREDMLDNLESVPYLEYPVWGALRHANVDPDGEVQDGLSAANAFNQGACAYMTKMAMLRMRHLIDANAERWNLVQAGGDNYVGVNLQVHDEIAVLAPKCLAKEVALALESAMKMILEPEDFSQFDTAYYDTQKPDARHDAGWLAIPDEKIVGRTLFDADAEVKATVAKAKTLANGEPNLLALLDEPETVEAFHDAHPLDVNEEHELTLARAGHTDRLI
jgi:hypothetical protein